MKEIRAESIHPKSVVFRPEKSFKEEFRHIPVTRTPEKRHSKHYSEEELDELLRNYFSNHTFITSSEFQEICRFTSATASRHLKKLTDEGKLKKTGHRRSPLYMPVEELYE